MASVNKVILVGHLGRDPETRYLPSGTAVTNISIATTEKWKDKDSGEAKERTEWTRCSMFGALAEAAGKYLKKGSLAYVEGSLRTNKYQKDGVDHYSTEVRVDRMQFLDRKASSGSDSSGDYAAASGSSRKAKDGGASEMADDIPF